MDNKENDKIIAFDSLFTTNQIQIFKILLSYMNPSVQKDLAVYIKFMELQYAVTFFQQHPFAVFHETDDETTNVTAIFDDIVPYCDGSQRDMLLQFKTMMQNVENMQEMMSTLEMLKDLFPEGIGDFGNLGSISPDFANMEDMMNLFRSMQDNNATDQ